MAKLVDDQAASPKLGRARRGLTLFTAQYLVKLPPGAQVQLSQDAAHLALHGVDRHVKLGRHREIAVSGGREHRDTPLLRR